MVCNLKEGVLKQSITDYLDKTSLWCGVDIFLLGPKLTPVVDGLNGDVELRRDQRWRIAIYGDVLSLEHAKTRVLIKIDQLVRPYVRHCFGIHLLTPLDSSRESLMPSKLNSLHTN